MFEFLFKRPGDAPNGQQPDAAQASAAVAASAQAEQTASRRAAQAERAKALAEDEAAAVELILQSEFADVRLAAAAHVVSQPALEKVQQAMRNTDRRVAKLMQSRLDAIRHQQAERRQAEATIANARKLLADEKLTPNQVAELDRLWKVIAAAPELAEEFNGVRRALAQRLEDQVNLQRAALDALAALRRVAGEADAAQLDALAEEHAKHVAAPEKGALPRNLLGDFETAMAEARSRLAAQEARRAAQDSAQANAAAAATAATAANINSADVDADAAAAAAAPGAANAAAGNGAVTHAADGNVHDAAGNPIRAAGQGAAAGGAGAGVAQSGNAQAGGAQAAEPHGPARHGAERAGKQRDLSPAAQEAAREANKRFMATLDAMEAALAEGQLHVANDHDKALKEIKTGRLTPAQADRLAHVRADLKRLGDWARWGGNVSREELVKAVEDLQGQQLAMAELAKKVGSMRDRWKALDTVSGPAPKGLWERFDAACTAAYAPAAAHFKHLADERHTNAAKAQALIAEVDALKARAAESETPDYKALAAASQRLRQAWGRLGAIDRKEKKKLDAIFGKAMDAMLAPLENQRSIEVACREQLIEETAKLNPSDRHTLDTLRILQERWQEHAKALPLERKQEQALWQRFRAACDAIFAARKESAHAADHERRAHLHAREAICAQLEQATFSGDDKAQQAAIAKALRDAATAWHASGTVPRASEQKIEARYKAAVAAVQAQGDAIRKRAGAAQANALRDKLRLTQALEAALAGAAADAAADAATDAAIDAADWDARWKALPALPNEYERTLHTRFAAALAAAADPDKRRAYAARLEAARASLLQEVLRLEIVAGVDSGAEFARERLKMQVEVLQSSLKSGQKPMTQAAQFLQLCAMPAMADPRTATRIEQLFRRIGAEAK
ncbi:hypothetical protein ASC94_14180 [Massilia sp. Root418]|uniref:DUF349 domain-containing protein n=1 Tax=Massilia sp. Root418 TaxID=1736532 RepID=UPI0006F7C62C|nr:DUF349 domain-containing protein [Massilia sp. Root418]KQW93731.1 hypothetical protein ASC94_14180 [Massilia sp. Root418]